MSYLWLSVDYTSDQVSLAPYIKQLNLGLRDQWSKPGQRPVEAMINRPREILERALWKEGKGDWPLLLSSGSLSVPLVSSTQTENIYISGHEGVI